MFRLNSLGSESDTENKDPYCDNDIKGEWVIQQHQQLRTTESRRAELAGTRNVCNLVVLVNADGRWIKDNDVCCG